MAFSGCMVKQRAALLASCLLFGGSVAFAGQQAQPAGTMARNSQGVGVFYNAEPMRRAAPKRSRLSKRSQQTTGSLRSPPARVLAIRDGYFTLLPPSRDDLQFYAHGMVPQAQSTSTDTALSTKEYWSAADRVFFSHGIFPQAQSTSTTIDGREMPEALKDPRPSS